MRLYTIGLYTQWIHYMFQRAAPKTRLIWFKILIQTNATISLYQYYRFVPTNKAKEKMKWTSFIATSSVIPISSLWVAKPKHSTLTLTRSLFRQELLWTHQELSMLSFMKVQCMSVMAIQPTFVIVFLKMSMFNDRWLGNPHTNLITFGSSNWTPLLFWMTPTFIIPAQVQRMFRIAFIQVPLLFIWRSMGRMSRNTPPVKTHLLHFKDMVHYSTFGRIRSIWRLQ